MSAFKQTVLDVILLSVLSVAIGLGGNAVRGSGKIKITKNYFRKGTKPTKNDPKTTPDKPSKVASRDAPKDDSPKHAEANPADRNSATAKDPGQPSQPAAKEVEHAYQKMSFADVAAIYEDPATAEGANVFLDARNDEAYETGHIPDSFQCDHYRLEKFLDAGLLEYLDQAERIIVYCNGGNCEDSIFLCADLIDEFEIPYEKVYLYGGGWAEWFQNEMPAEEGRE